MVGEALYRGIGTQEKIWSKENQPNACGQGWRGVLFRINHRATIVLNVIQVNQKKNLLVVMVVMLCPAHFQLVRIEILAF